MIKMQLKYVLVFALLQLMQLSAFPQDMGAYLIEAYIDTTIEPRYTFFKCFSPDYPELKKIPGEYTSIMDDNGVPKRSPPTVSIKGNLTYLFVWKNEEIFVALCEPVDLKNEKDFQRSPDLRNIKFVSSIQPNYQFFVDEPDKRNRIRIDRKRRNLFYQVASVSLELSDNEFATYRRQAQKERDIAIKFAFPGEGNDHDIIQVSFNDKENPKNFRVIKYWVYSNLLLASRFNEHWFGTRFLPYHSIELHNTRLDSVNLRKMKNWKQSYILIAESKNPDLESLSAKWQTLFKYRVYGENSCMVPHTVFPTREVLHTEMDSNIKRRGGRPNDYNRSDSIYFFNDRTVYDFRRSIECRSIYAVNPIDGTINNLEYLPEVYFLPDYLKIQSINNQSLEEFVRERCK